MGQLSLASRNQGQKGDAGAGVVGPSGAGAQGLWQPSDNAYLAAVCDPLYATGAGSPSAGYLYLSRLRVATASPVTNIHLWARSAASAGVSGAYMGLYTAGASAWSLLAQTADFAASLSGNASDVKVALTAATASQPAGTNLWAAFLFAAATTGPNIRAAGIGNANSNLVAASPYRVAVATATGFTTLPATLNFAASGPAPFQLGMALS